MASGNRFVSVDEFCLDSKWLIDPNQLFVGPNIGEGAHAKVYEGLFSFMEIARAELPPSDPNRLDLSLKLAVFHYDIQNAPEVALEIARKASDEVTNDESAMAMASEESKKKLKMIKKKITKWDVVLEDKEDGSSSEDEYGYQIPNRIVRKEKIQGGSWSSEKPVIFS